MEILHIARSDLQEISVLRHEFNIVLVYDLSYYAQTGSITHIAKNLQPLKAEPLKVIGTRTRLECASTQKLSACFLDLDRNIVELIIALHGAGSRHDGELLTANGEPCHVHNRIRWMEVTADQLVLFCNTNRFLNSLHHIHLKTRDNLLIADHTDDEAILTL